MNQHTNPARTIVAEASGVQSHKYPPAGYHVMSHSKEPLQIPIATAWTLDKSITLIARSDDIRRTNAGVP